MNIDKLAFD